MAQSKLLVSVLVPTKNSEKYLEKCLVSIKRQSYPKIEIIVIDNFSQDKTLKIAKKYTKKVFQKGPERSAQLNFGAKKAKGKYLYRVDSDFVVDKHHIKNMVEKCERESFDAIATFNRSDPRKSFWAKVKNLERETYREEDLILASRFLTKKAFEQVGGFDEELIAAEDYDLQNRLLKAGFKIGKVKTADTHLGEPDSIWQIAKESFYYGETLAKYLRKHPQRGLKQAIPIRPSYLKHWKDFAQHPFLTLGLFLMKLVVYVSAGLGFLLSQTGFIFLLIAILGAFLRFPFLDRKPILFDEANTLSLAASDLATLVRGTLTDVHPPLYYLILKFWLKINDSLVWARLLSLIFGAVNIFLAGKVAKTVFNRKVGVLAAIVFCFSPSLIVDSTIARMYPLAQLFSLLIIYFFLVYIKKQDFSSKAGLALTLFLGFLTHYFLLFILLPLNFAFFYFKRKYKLNLASWIEIQAVSLIPFLILIFPFFKPTSILPVQSLLKIPAVFVTYAISWQGWLMGDFFPFGKSISASLPVYFLTAYLFVLAIFSLRKSRRFQLPVVFFWAIILLPILAIAFLSYLVKPMFGMGSFTVFVPAYYFLIALGIASFRNRKIRILLIAVLIFLNGLILVDQFSQFTSLKNEFLQPIKFLERNYSPGDIIAHTDLTTYTPFRYHLEDLNHALVFPFYFAEEMNQALRIRQENIEEFEKNYKRFWYLDLSNSAQQKTIKQKLKSLNQTYQGEKKATFPWYGKAKIDIYLYNLENTK